MAAAVESYNDVVTRTATISSIVENPRLLTLMGMPQVDFGADVVAKSKAAVAAVAAD